MMLAIATPEMINPVADQCEANGVPCLSTLAPWQPYFFGRGRRPRRSGSIGRTTSSGVPSSSSACSSRCGTRLETNKKVGLLCPNDPDGNALADPETGFPAGAAAAGYTVVDPGRFQVLSDDFSRIIGQFKDEGVEIVVGIPIPPDFATFWTQANQQDFNPKLVTMAKAVLFPSAVEALGDLGDGLASEIWWTPDHPVHELAHRRAARRTRRPVRATRPASSGRSSLGFVHALFEETFDVLARAGSTDKQAIADAAAATNLDTIVGPLQYGTDGVPEERHHDARSSADSGRRPSGGEFQFDLVVTNNKLSPEIPLDGDLQPLA